MSDQVNETTNVTGEGVPGQEPQPSATQPSYVTADQLNHALDEIKGMLNKSYQGVQSREDKFQNKVKAELDRLTSVLGQSGIRLTDAQKQQVTSNLILDAFNEAPQASQPAASQSETVELTPLQKQIDAQVDAMLAAAKIGEFEDNDPELAEVEKFANSTPLEYLRAVERAIKAKQERLAQSQVNPQQSAARTPMIGTAGASQSNSVQDINDLDSLWGMTSLGKK